MQIVEDIEDRKRWRRMIRCGDSYNKLSKAERGRRAEINYLCCVECTMVFFCLFCKSNEIKRLILVYKHVHSV